MSENGVAELVYIHHGDASNQPREARNKLGKNQYKDRPPRDDPHVAEILKAYYLKGINDKTQISKLILEEHGITLSPSSIGRRKRELGLRCSRITTRELSTEEKRQLILDQIAKDPAGKYGPRTVKQRIFEETGIHLTRDYIRAEMKILDPVGSSTRGPAHVKARRQRLAEEEADEPKGQEFVLDGGMNSGPPLSEEGSEADLDMPMEEVLRTTSTSVAIRQETHLFPETRQLPQPLQTTSASTRAVLDTLNNLVPQMRSLTREIDSSDGAHSVSNQEYAFLLDAMESSALLERALSRLVSRSRPFDE